MTTPYDLPIAQHLCRLWPDEFGEPYIGHAPMGEGCFIKHPQGKSYLFTLSDDATCWRLWMRFHEDLHDYIITQQRNYEYVPLTNESFAEKLNEMLEGM